MNPMMVLDQDSLSRLETVLQSDEGKNLITEVLKGTVCLFYIIISFTRILDQES